MKKKKGVWTPIRLRAVYMGHDHMSMNKITTYLADTRIHLPLWEYLIEREGNLGGVQVLSLESFLSSKMPHPVQDRASILFEYERILKKAADEGKLDDNLFLPSISDYDFLLSCYSFISLAKTYQIQSYPMDTKKDRDLAVILNELGTVYLWQQDISRLQEEEFDNIHIVSPFFSQDQQALLSGLREKGADWFKKGRPGSLHYWSLSNIRKVMEKTVLEILENDYRAEDIQIILADPSDRYILEQVLQTYSIPYTFLDNPNRSPVIDQFRKAFHYIRNKSKENLSALLKALYPRTSVAVRRYLDLFDEETMIRDMEYEENPILDEGQFLELQSLEAQAMAWKGVIDSIQNWDIASLPEIAQEIQLQNDEPTMDDIDAMDRILSAWQNALPSVKSREDLDLFIAWLDHFSPRTSVQELKGVIIGTSETLSNIRPIVFYLGASAATYPGNVIESGIFNEKYLSRLPVPDLSTKMSRQKELMERFLSQAETLYIMIAQSDFEGKPIEASAELSLFAQTSPKFQTVPERSIHSIPDFSLPQESAKALFESNGTYNYSIRQIDTFQDCPYKHFLHSGVSLKKEHLTASGRYSRSRLFSFVLGRILGENGSLEHIDKEDIQHEVENAFHLVSSIFPGREQDINREIYQNTEIFTGLVEQLRELEKENILLDPYPQHLEIRDEQVSPGIQIEGNLLGKGGKSPLTLRDPRIAFNPGLNGINPLGSLAVRVQNRPIEREKYSVSYQGKGSASLSESSYEKLEMDYHTRFFNDSLVAHGLDENHPLYSSLSGKANIENTYRHLQEELTDRARKMSEAIGESSLLPEHRKDACKHCYYRVICRNGSKERK